MARSRALSRGGLIRGSVRRKSSWEEGPGSQTVLTTTASAAAVVGSGLQLLVDGLTLVRLRGQFTSFLSIAGAAGDNFVGAFGVGIATDQAFAIGVSALKIPITDQDWDGWLYWQAIQLIAAEPTEQFGNAGTASMVVQVDSKAMRKVNLGDTVYGVIEVVEGGGGGSTILSFFDSRLLFKLP